MNALTFAWRSLVRQPARALLGVLGIAAAGALLFDMLLLSRGLVISMERLLDRTGFDIRVSTVGSRPGTGSPIADATTTSSGIAGLREVASTMPIRLADGEIPQPRATQALWTTLVGSDASHRHAWTVVDGRDLRESAEPEVLINRNLAEALHQGPGHTITVRSSCGSGRSAIPSTTLRVVGVAEFPFDNFTDMSALMTLQDLDRACGGQGRDVADQILVATAAGVNQDAAIRAIERLRPDLEVMSNQQLIERFQGELSYFRQISLVLVVVTIGFAFLLVAVLLTVSVNQRVGEIAALRALGFSQRRVVADVLCESGLLVGVGATLALPAGLVLARGLDWILKAIPGIPPELHFFVFQPRAVLIHVALFVATALLAATYPMQMVARLPIAGTLRKEIRVVTIVEARNITREFPMPAGPVVAVRDVSLRIESGDYVALCGPSGCGKSTLLHLLGCVDAPTSGTLLFEEHDVATLRDKERSAIRLTRLGFIFQRFFLLPMLTAAENVELPLAEAGASKTERARRTSELLEYVGLSRRADHRPSQLSGGEMQRVAIARALANAPRLLLADEPTGELDQATGEQIAELLDRVNADGTALVIVTHDPAFARRSQRLLTMRDGVIVEEEARA